MPLHPAHRAVWHQTGWFPASASDPPGAATGTDVAHAAMSAVLERRDEDARTVLNGAQAAGLGAATGGRGQRGSHGV